jgi:hypothetical protein
MICLWPFLANARIIIRTNDQQLIACSFHFIKLHHPAITILPGAVIGYQLIQAHFKQVKELLNITWSYPLFGNTTGAQVE